MSKIIIVVVVVVVISKWIKFHTLLEKRSTWVSP